MKKPKTQGQTLPISGILYEGLIKIGSVGPRSLDISKLLSKAITEFFHPQEDFVSLSYYKDNQRLPVMIRNIKVDEDVYNLALALLDRYRPYVDEEEFIVFDSILFSYLLKDRRFETLLTSNIRSGSGLYDPNDWRVWYQKSVGEEYNQLYLQTRSVPEHQLSLMDASWNGNTILW
jgi:hypothetical protein